MRGCVSLSLVNYYILNKYFSSFLPFFEKQVSKKNRFSIMLDREGEGEESRKGGRRGGRIASEMVSGGEGGRRALAGSADDLGFFFSIYLLIFLVFFVT